MANKKSQATFKPFEMELDIEINWAKNSKIPSLNLSLIENNEYKDIQKDW